MGIGALQTDINNTNSAVYFKIRSGSALFDQQGSINDSGRLNSTGIGHPLEEYMCVHGPEVLLDAGHRVKWAWP